MFDFALTTDAIRVSNTHLNKSAPERVSIENAHIVFIDPKIINFNQSIILTQTIFLFVRLP